MQNDRAAPKRVAGAPELERDDRRILERLNTYVLRDNAGAVLCAKNRLKGPLKFDPAVKSMKRSDFRNVGIENRGIVCEASPEGPPIQGVKGGDEAVKGCPRTFPPLQFGPGDDGGPAEHRGRRESGNPPSHRARSQHKRS